MKRYLFLITTDALEPEDEVMVEVSAESEATARILATSELRAHTLNPTDIQCVSNWRTERYRGPQLTCKGDE